MLPPYMTGTMPELTEEEENRLELSHKILYLNNQIKFYKDLNWIDVSEKFEHELETLLKENSNYAK